MNQFHIPSCLQRLALGLDADARAIRRAYARELKLIDQETDAAGFQSLREEYESALRWAAHQAWEKEHGDDFDETVEATAAEPAPAISPAISPAVAAPPLPDADDLAQAVFERLLKDCAALVTEQTVGDLPSWERILTQRLQDDELFNITARTIFEGRVAYWLAEGWEPGKETLFAAAARVFKWDQDKRRLQQYGYAGSKVNQAIEERAMFLLQAEAELGAQRKAILRLRANLPLSAAQLQRDMYYVEQMLSRFPTLMELSISTVTVEQWRAEFERLGLVLKEPRPDVIRPEPKPKKSLVEGLVTNFFIGLAVLVVVFIIVAISDDKPRPTRERKAVPQVPQRSLRQEAPLDKEFTDAIVKDVHIEWPASAKPGVYKVKYEVFVDEAGKVVGMNRLESSGVPVLDEAIKAAISRSKPFPPTAGIRVILQYSVTLTREKRAPVKPRPAPPETAPAAPEKVWEPHGPVEAGDAPASARQ